MIAIVLGSAEGNWTDYERALELIGELEHVVVACNHALRDAPFYIANGASMHPDLFPLWLRDRRAKGLPDPGRLWHARHRPVPDGIESTAVESWGGSSGMLCVAVAFELKCDRVVLAGVPMHKSFGHFDDPRPWQEARAYRQAWEAREPMLRGRVKSMSGWTRDLLGEPGEGEWLGPDRPAAAAP